MSAVTAVYERFLSFRRIPLKVVFVTLLASWALQVGAIFLNQPIYVIALFTILPWIPLALFEGLWKYKHYNWLAIFAVVTVLQVGHIGEHAVQVTELAFLNGTLSCPPPVDNQENAQRAVDAGLRSEADPTGYSAVRVVVPDEETGQPATGNVVGPPACGVFGQFDFEPIHLIWDTLVWLGGLVLLTRFPRNIFLWIAVIFASLHEVEHLFLGYIYLFDSGAGSFEIARQLWGTTAEGSIVTANPVGLEDQPVNFYAAGGLTGIMGKNGLVESLFLGQMDLFPLRPYLHFIYNSMVVLPTVLAFLVQSRKAYDEYLDEALPALTEEQKIRTSTKLDRETFEPGEVIVRQGDPADRFYIITRGQVEVLREQNGQEILVSRLGTGQYFGEIGLMHGGKRVATVRAADDVEVMALDRDTFGGLMDESEMSREQVERLTRQRVSQLQALRSDG
jgi:hypothetical protein